MVRPFFAHQINIRYVLNVLPHLGGWFIRSNIVPSVMTKLLEVKHWSASRRNPQLPQPRHQVFLWPVTLDPVAVSAQQLQALDVALAPAS